jgi:hypothetical protein
MPRRGGPITGKPASQVVPSVANRWSHAHGKTSSEVVPFTWQPTPRFRPSSTRTSAGAEYCPVTWARNPRRPLSGRTARRPNSTREVMPEQDGCSTPSDDVSVRHTMTGPARLSEVSSVCGLRPVDPVRYRGVRRANTRPPGRPRSPAPLTPAKFSGIELGGRCGSSPAGRRGEDGAGLRHGAGQCQRDN